MEEREALGKQGRDTETVEERIRDAEAKLDELTAAVRELRQLVSGRTPTLSRQGTSILFNDWPMPFRVYEGDNIELSVGERDPLQDDLLGRTGFVVDAVMLDTGHLELRTGWVQSLSLGFVPCDADGDGS